MMSAEVAKVLKETEAIGTISNFTTSYTADWKADHNRYMEQ